MSATRGEEAYVDCQGSRASRWRDLPKGVQDAWEAEAERVEQALITEARGVAELRAAIEQLRSQVGHDRAKYMTPSVILDEKQSSTLAAALERFGMQLDALLAGVER